MEQNQKPIETFSAGAVSAGVWENEATVNGKTVTILKASVGRRYKDRNDNWKTTYSFSRNEIALAIYCLQKAFEAIIEKAKQDSSDIEGESVV